MKLKLSASGLVWLSVMLIERGFQLAPRLAKMLAMLTHLVKMLAMGSKRLNFLVSNFVRVSLLNSLMSGFARLRNLLAGLMCYLFGCLWKNFLRQANSPVFAIVWLLEKVLL